MTCPTGHAVHLHSCPAVTKKLEDPVHQAPWQGEAQELQLQHAMVHGIVGPVEVEWKQNELLGRPTLHRPTPRLRPVPAVLDVLDEASHMLLRSAASAEADLLRRHQLAGSDHPLDEFGDVDGQRDAVSQNYNPAWVSE